MSIAQPIRYVKYATYLTVTRRSSHCRTASQRAASRVGKGESRAGSTPSRSAHPCRGTRSTLSLTPLR